MDYDFLLCSIFNSFAFIYTMKEEFWKKIKTKIDFDLSPMFEKLLSTNTSKWMNLYKHTKRQFDSKDIKALIDLPSDWDLETFD